MKADLFIPASQNALMHLINIKVSQGYRYHQAGEIPITKAVALAEKFDTKFEWSAGRVRRQLFKRKGLANTFLYFYKTKKLDTLCWFLLATEGDLPDSEKASFKDQFHHKQSIYFDNRYRLEHFQRENFCGGGRRYTWMIAPKRLQEFEAHILELCGQPNAKGVKELIGLFEAFEKMPLSHGITHNLHQLRQLAMKNWRLNVEFPIPKIDRNYNDFSTKLYGEPPLTLVRLVEDSLRKISELSIGPANIPELVLDH